MESSILKFIRKKVGGEVECTAFDEDILSLINMAFGFLTQIGVGPKEGFVVENELTRWEDFTTNRILLSMVKDYVYLRVRLVFDPPASSYVVESINKTILELETRLYSEVEFK